MAVPLGMKLTMAWGQNEKQLNAECQWLYSLFHIAQHIDDGIKQFVLEDKQQQQAILIDVLAVLQCPAELPHCEETAEETPSLTPMILVRFSHSRRKDAKHKQTMESIKSSRTDGVVPQEGTAKVKAETEEEVEVAAEVYVYTHISKL
jgi:hypothetical protein